MIDNQQTAILKSNQDLIKIKKKYPNTLNRQRIGKLCQSYVSYTAMACDVLLIIAMIAFLFKYRKTMQVMLAAFLQINTKNTGIQSI